MLPYSKNYYSYLIIVQLVARGYIFLRVSEFCGVGVTAAICRRTRFHLSENAPVLQNAETKVKHSGHFSECKYENQGAYLYRSQHRLIVEHFYRTVYMGDKDEARNFDCWETGEN